MITVTCFKENVLWWICWMYCNEVRFRVLSLELMTKMTVLSLSQLTRKLSTFKVDHLWHLATLIIKCTIILIHVHRFVTKASNTCISYITFVTQVCIIIIFICYDCNIIDGSSIKFPEFMKKVLVLDHPDISYNRTGWLGVENPQLNLLASSRSI